MMGGTWRVQTDNSGRIFLMIETGNKQYTHEMSIDGARKIGDALVRASQHEGSRMGVKLGDFVNAH